jgi:hypothetical protein
MAIPNYAYLKLKLPSPHGVITIGGDLHQAHSCEEENLNIVAAVVRASELRTIQTTVAEVTPESITRKQSTGAFKPTEDTKAVQVNPEDTSKTVRIGCGLFDRQECKVINFLLQNRYIFAWKPSDMSGIPR